MVGAPEPGKTDESLATLPLGTTRCLLKEGDADPGVGGDQSQTNNNS